MSFLEQDVDRPGRAARPTPRRFVDSEVGPLRRDGATMTNAERERVQGFGRLEEGLRQAGGWYLWVNRVRRKGETMGMGFNALVLTTIGCTSGRERDAVASMVGRDPR